MYRKLFLAAYYISILPLTGHAQFDYLKSLKDTVKNFEIEYDIQVIKFKDEEEVEEVQARSKISFSYSGDLIEYENTYSMDTGYVLLINQSNKKCYRDDQPVEKCIKNNKYIIGLVLDAYAKEDKRFHFYYQGDVRRRLNRKILIRCIGFNYDSSGFITSGNLYFHKGIFVGGQVDNILKINKNKFMSICIERTKTNELYINKKLIYRRKGAMKKAKSKQ